MLEQSQQNLASLIVACSQGEQAVENQRRILSEQYDFTPRHFFSLVTPNNAITSRDLQNFLSSHQIQASVDQVLMLIKQYSNLQDGRLDYEDFLQVFLPSTDLPLRQRVRERPTIKTFAQKTLENFLNVLKEELQYQEKLEECKQSLYQAKDFSVYTAFEVLANGKNFVEEEDLVRFLGKFESGMDLDQFEAFLRRTDLQGDGFINYNEFLDFVVPFNVPQGRTASREAEEMKTPEKRVKSFGKPQEKREKTLENPEKTLERSEKPQEKSEKPQEKPEKPQEKPKKPQENPEKTSKISEKVTESKSSEKAAKTSEKVEEKKEVQAKSESQDPNDQLNWQIFELFSAVKAEETHRQNLACLSEVLISDIQEVLTSSSFPDALKRSLIQDNKETETEAIFQVLGPLDSDYQLNVVSQASVASHNLCKALIKQSLESFLNVQNLIEQVLQSFSSIYGSGKSRTVSFNTEFIIQSLGTINACLLERDLNLLLNRLDLTD